MGRGSERSFATTALAALKLWSFWALAAAVISGLVLQFDPEIDLTRRDSRGSQRSVWVTRLLHRDSYWGRFVSFRPIVIWLLPCSRGRYLSAEPQSSAGSFRDSPLTFSVRKLACLAVALLAVGMLPLQLGSPVAPYMDVLSYPASVQANSVRSESTFLSTMILTWMLGHRARPDSRPRVVLRHARDERSRVNLGVLGLAQSAVMLPIMLRSSFSLHPYRLGVTLANDTVGGVASLILFLDTIYRKLTGMRGTAYAADFALVWPAWSGILL